MAVDIENELNQPSESETRINQLSKKVSLAVEERDAEKTARETAEAKTADAERRASFAEGFTDVVANNPAAKEFKADIQAKVMSGYSVEDATYAVLGKAGKLGQPKVEETQTAGGSSATQLPNNGGNKTVSEMTQDERRAALSDVLVIT